MFVCFLPPRSRACVCCVSPSLRHHACGSSLGHYLLLHAAVPRPGQRSESHLATLSGEACPYYDAVRDLKCC